MTTTTSYNPYSGSRILFSGYLRQHDLYLHTNRSCCAVIRHPDFNSGQTVYCNQTVEQPFVRSTDTF
jgi:hypothetical protein